MPQRSTQSTAAGHLYARRNSSEFSGCLGSVRLLEKPGGSQKTTLINLCEFTGSLRGACLLNPPIVQARRRDSGAPGNLFSIEYHQVQVLSVINKITIIGALGTTKRACKSWLTYE